jgi:hypothetical protein
VVASGPVTGQPVTQLTQEVQAVNQPVTQPVPPAGAFDPVTGQPVPQNTGFQPEATTPPVQQNQTAITEANTTGVLHFFTNCDFLFIYHHYSSVIV